MQLLQLYATGVTTADAVAQVIVPKSGRIAAINVTAAVEDAAGDGECAWEVSLQSTQQLSINDAQNVLLSVNGRVNASDTICNINHQALFPGGVTVQAGTRIYLHRVARTAATGGVCNVNILLQ